MARRSKKKDAPQGFEFSRRTMNVPVLLEASSGLLQHLKDYQGWVDRYGFESPATAEALLNRILDSYLVLYELVRQFEDRLKQATVCDTELAYLVKILVEAKHKIGNEVANKGVLPSENETAGVPGLARVRPNSKPFRFSECLVAQIGFGVEAMKQWPAEELAAERPLPRWHSHYAGPTDPVPDEFRYGPLVGNQSELAGALYPGVKLPRERQLKAAHGSPVFVRQLTKKRVEVYFRMQERLAAAEKHLAERRRARSASNRTRGASHR